MNRLGSTLLRFDSVTSTNDIARDLAASGAQEGIAVVAREQTAGRGSKGRSWSSPAGEGLYVSLILRPQIEPGATPLLTLTAGVAVAETLAIDYAAPADIKWPNDVLLNGRKLCGILVESATEGRRLRHAVLGIGVNLKQREFPADISGRATSLLLETGRTVEPDDFLVALFERLERWYSLAVTSPSDVLERYESLSSYARNCRVRVQRTSEDEAELEGVTCGLTPSGALIIETDAGERRILVSGEIGRVRAIAGEKV